jgi:hypothetical protein
MRRITTPLLKLSLTGVVIKVNIKQYRFMPERDEYVTKVIRVMIKFNKSVMIRPSVIMIRY